MTPEQEVAFLRAAVRAAIAASSIRDVAARAGVSHGCMHRVATGVGKLYGKTVTKLRTWYLKEVVATGGGFTPEAAVYLVEQMLAAVPPGERCAAALEVVSGLEAIYDRLQVPRPDWLRAVTEEYGASATPQD